MSSALYDAFGAFSFSFIYHILGIGCLSLTGGLVYASFWCSGVVCLIARIISIAYACWYVYDFRTPLRGRNHGRWSRPFINPFRLAVLDYLSYRIVFDRDAERKTSAVAGTKFYCCHPHGVQSAATNMGLLVDRKIAGRPIVLVTLNLQFYIPFWRELMMSYGLLGGDKQSIIEVIKRGSEDIAIVVGGARETAKMYEGEIHVVLGRRKGVFELALTYGIPLVPVLNFGENEIYKQIIFPDPIRKFQFKLLDKMSMFPIAFTGRCLIFPRKVPVTAVFGEPILVNKVEGKPSEDQIHQLRAIYVEALKSLHERNKMFGPKGTSKLIIE